MDKDKLYEQYLYEVSLFEKYGSKNVITFDEWKWIKSAMENTQPVDESQLKLYRELLGHLPGDKETLDYNIYNYDTRGNQSYI